MCTDHDDNEPPDCEDGAIHRAEEALTDAQTGLKDVVAELERVEHDVERAEHDLHEAERHHTHEVLVTVDREPHKVPAGRYLVSDFKLIVGVAANRELDLIRDGKLEPLPDDSHIEICHHEVFVSHVKTGGSA
jgi:hypothetical protein